MIYQGDCLELLETIDDDSVDFVLTDPPYAKTECHWDKPVDLGLLMKHLHRVTKPSGAIAIFSAQPFTTDLVNASRDTFKYCWYWVKNKSYGFTHAKNKPLNKLEEICIFSRGSVAHQKYSSRMAYFPQGVVAGKTKVVKPGLSPNIQPRPKQVGKEYQSYSNFPTNVLEYSKEAKSLHPSQKPVELLKYLIRTYTVECETVLDCFAGSGSTGVAAKETGREWVMMEREEKYIEIIKGRMG